MKHSMKMLPLLALALVVGSWIGFDPMPRASADDPEPPPVDCPLCGGNAVEHNRRMRFLAEYQGTLVLWRFADSSVWR
jgi:hypothetical protein